MKSSPSNLITSQIFRAALSTAYSPEYGRRLRLSNDGSRPSQPPFWITSLLKRRNAERSNLTTPPTLVEVVRSSDPVADFRNGSFSTEPPVLRAIRCLL